MPRKTLYTKHQVREALIKAEGNQAQAARILGIGKSTVNKYVKQFDLKDLNRALDDEILDVAENVIYEKVRSGNLPAAIYVTKCKGKHRGWVERPETQVNIQADNAVIAAPETLKSSQDWQNKYLVKPEEVADG